MDSLVSIFGIICFGAGLLHIEFDIGFDNEFDMGFDNEFELELRCFEGCDYSGFDLEFMPREDVLVFVFVFVFVFVVEVGWLGFEAFLDGIVYFYDYFFLKLAYFFSTKSVN